LVKNCCRFIAGDLKAFYQFFVLIFFTLTRLCKFFAKGLKSEGERLKVKFSSLEMVKIGRGSKTIAAVAVATAFRVL
jgi:hypothetical protein